MKTRPSKSASITARLAATPGIPRRMMLRALGSIALAPILAGCPDERLNPVPGPFLDPADRETLDALADVILPPDQDPGGAALGASDYVEGLMTALEGDTPRWFAGGPFSGRNPYPNADGSPSDQFPENEFETFLELDRVSKRALEILLYGSKGVEGGAPNDAILGEVVGLRDQVKTGLAAARGFAKDGTLVGLSAEDAFLVFASLTDEFKKLLVELVTEAAFAIPEYGGNKDLAGWKMVHVEGDVAPYGFSLYDATKDAYVELEHAPVSTPSTDPDPEPMDDEVLDFLKSIVLLGGGEVFS